MACRTVLRSVFVTEPWRPLQRNLNFHSVKALRSFGVSTAKRGFYVRGFRLRDIHSGKRTPKLSCSHDERPSSSSASEEDDLDRGPPQEAVLKAISEVSMIEGRVGQTTNMVIGGTVADDSTDEWLTLDQKVNSYPTVRGFTAIGTGGDDFVQAMVVAVESVIQQPIPEWDWPYRQDPELERLLLTVNGLPLQAFTSNIRGIIEQVIAGQGRVRQKISSRGKYVSVNIGPVRVVSSEQVQAVYNAMRRDDRMKYFL